MREGDDEVAVLVDALDGALDAFEGTSEETDALTLTTERKERWPKASSTPIARMNCSIWRSGMVMTTEACSSLRGLMVMNCMWVQSRLNIFSSRSWVRLE